MYGDASLKERVTLNPQNTSESQEKYSNLLKDHELLRTKYENLLLENAVSHKNLANNRVFL